jgi:DNA repair exonuclease SbcCD ATPase subunit
MLKYIFHVSDIHIRNGDAKYCRYIEYDDVFNRLYDSLQTKTKEIANEDFIILLTGDIFHNKNNIGNHGLLLYKTLLEKLTSIGRTIIFHGNHDKNQNEVDQPSLLASTFQIPNLTILDKSTSFSIDDIGFSYVSIDDTLDTYKTCGRIDTLPPFPEIENKVKYKIALFHGTFAQVRLYNGNIVADEHKPYPFEWIKDFDFAILGDIHLRQYGIYNNKTLWGYSGSLIQQNYGEDIINHGYMIWDIKEKKIEEVNVYNNTGLINIKQEHEELSIRVRGKYENFEKYIKTNIIMFPRHVDIKLHSNIDRMELIKLLSNYNISYHIFGVNSDKELINDSDNNGEKYDDEDIHVDKNTILKHFHKHLSEEQHCIFGEIIKNNEYLLFDTNAYPDELHGECHKKNKELSVMINNCTKSSDNKAFKYPFKVKYLEWSNLYCYENINYIDFESTYRNTFLISGNNGTGKSAIYDILVLAIWGEITTTKQNPLSAGIINHKHDNAYTIIDIISGNSVYRIKRLFSSLSNKYTLNKQKISLYRDNNIFKKDNACTSEILKITGSLEEFLASSMITQNVDYDILKMNYKDCLSMIDKATNIDYVYNLYTLFKGCINKYKDLHKIIESKKQVYEKLIHNDEITINGINKTNIYECKANLGRLTNNRMELIAENNSIAINLNDPKNDTILSTNYEEIIKNTDDKLELSADAADEYDNIKAKYNHLSVVLKGHGHDDNSIAKLAEMSHEKVEEFDKPVKPCELSFIKEQEAYLTQLTQKFTINPILNEKYQNIDIKELTTICQNLQRDREHIVLKIENANNVKPITTSDPGNDESVVSTQIVELYDSIEALVQYCQQNSNRTINQAHDQPSNAYYKLETYDKTVKNMRIYQKKSATLKTNISELESHIMEVINEKSKLIAFPEPSVDIDIKDSVKIQHTIELFGDISKIKDDIKSNENILAKYSKELDNVLTIEKKKQEFESELYKLKNTEEYKFDPSCKYCCKRPWVCRITELEGLINEYNIFIDDFYFNNDIEHLTLFNTNKEMMDQVLKYELYNEWYSYINYKERQDSLSSLYNEKTTELNMLKAELNEIENKVIKSERIQTKFHLQSHSLYKKHLDILAYKQYTEWKKEYDDLTNKKIGMDAEIKEIFDFITYENDIRPRIEKLKELKESYEKWKQYDDNMQIQNAKEFYKLKAIIDLHQKMKEHKENASKKQLIIRKISVTDRLTKLENEIHELNNIISKYEANTSFYEKNIESYQRLCSTLAQIDRVIEVVDIIITRFKHYRKEIYDNYIIKNLITKANKYIQTLCHSDTKQFTLDYVITEVKDILHINWLVRIENNNTKQLISVHQASGFQQFVISLALRMSLFSNKTCEQLFFDEGFTACDKNNLSIVPTFLKGLLNLFNSVIIVSHIDIIQESTDMMTRIEYNNITKSSSIMYGKSS